MIPRVGNADKEMTNGHFTHQVVAAYDGGGSGDDGGNDDEEDGQRAESLVNKAYCHRIGKKKKIHKASAAESSVNENRMRPNVQLRRQRLRLHQVAAEHCRATTSTAATSFNAFDCDNFCVFGLVGVSVGGNVVKRSRFFKRPRKDLANVDKAAAPASSTSGAEKNRFPSAGGGGSCFHRIRPKGIAARRIYKVPNLKDDVMGQCEGMEMVKKKKKVDNVLTIEQQRTGTHFPRKRPYSL
jgi:hypothetical protein